MCCTLGYDYHSRGSESESDSNGDGDSADAGVSDGIFVLTDHHRHGIDGIDRSL